MNIIRPFLYIPVLAVLTFASCSDKESYADLLADENQACNEFLSNYAVIAEVPADSVFISVNDVMAEQHLSAADATKLTPYYRMDKDGYVYMQVVNPGTPGNKVTDNQLVYFRFTRYNLTVGYKYDTWEEQGNSSDLASNTTSFRFGNTSLTSTTQWGEGIQVPLKYLSLDCEVNILIKSYMGPTDEVASVYPYIYSVRYFPSKI